MKSKLLLTFHNQLPTAVTLATKKQNNQVATTVPTAELMITTKVIFTPAQPKKSQSGENDLFPGEHYLGTNLIRNFMAVTFSMKLVTFHENTDLHEVGHI